MPGSRAFVDTSVLVYAVDEAEPRKRDHALLEQRSGELVVSTQVLSEFYAVVTRRLERPMSEADAELAVRELARLPLVVTDAGLVLDGVAISRQARLSFWDGLIVAAAHASGCETLLTEDLDAGSTLAGVGSRARSEGAPGQGCRTSGRSGPAGRGPAPTPPGA